MKSKRKKALFKGNTCDKKIDERISACVTALRALQETVASKAAQIPPPGGIFVGEDDRTKACLAICNLLMASEGRDVALRKAITDLVGTRSDETFADAWRLFYEQTVTAFFARIGSVADLEHEGKDCNPLQLSSLCRDFCASVDLFLKTYADRSR